MMSEACRFPHALATVDVWPPDDTEESVVGTDLHQMTIINLRWGLNEMRRLVEQFNHHQHLAEIGHRGATIRKPLQQRTAFRHRRRSANLRYRARRCANRHRPKGWLPPSLQARVDNTVGWVWRYRRLAPVATLSVEHVRFDLQKMEHPEIQGVEYQQGSLAGYEVREYLLEKWGRRCAYCEATDVPLQIDHIRAQARGGSNRVSNLTLACQRCNEAKGATPVQEFLRDKPEVLGHVLAQAQRPLAAAAVNTTRWALVEHLRACGLPLELSSGGRTKWNRSRLAVPKEHSLDAACVGQVAALHGWHTRVLCIGCMGRGSYQRTRLTKAGFPRGYLMCQKRVRGFQTGDMVKAVVPSGTKKGEYVGRVAIRATGSFNIQTATGVVQGISWKHCVMLSRADGHAYTTKGREATVEHVPLARPLLAASATSPRLKPGVSGGGF